MKLLIVNGPNLNLLHKRDRKLYGELDLNSIRILIEKEFPQITFDFFQSNDEKEIIERIQDAPDKFNGIIINPGGLSHSSVSLRDALEICSIPKVEVHLSNISSREKFRNLSITSSVCDGYIAGLKQFSYIVAIYAIQKIIFEKNYSR